MKQSKIKRQTVRPVLVQEYRDVYRDITEELLDLQQKVSQFGQNLARMSGTVQTDPKTKKGKFTFASRADCVRVGLMFASPFTAKGFEVALKDNKLSYSRFRLQHKTRRVKTPTDAIRTRLYKDDAFKNVGRGLFVVDRRKVLLDKKLAPLAIAG